MKKYSNHIVFFSLVDKQEIEALKKRFKHSVKPLVYGKRHFFADCLEGEAVAGTFETVIMQLIEYKDVGRRLLNLGAGSGQSGDIFTDIGYDVYNLDKVFSQDSLNDRQIYFDLNSNEDLPWADNSFDVIVCQEVIEHIENPWQLFRQMTRCLKNDGMLILTTPNIVSDYSKKIFKKTGFWHCFTPECWDFHINPMPFWQVELIAKKSQLTLLDLLGSGDYYFHKNGGIKKNECLIFVFKKRG